MSASLMARPVAGDNQREESQTLIGEGWKGCVCMCAYQQFEWGCRTWGLIGPGVGKHGDWNPGAATGQTQCLSTDMERLHIIHMYTYISNN